MRELIKRFPPMAGSVWQTHVNVFAPLCVFQVRFNVNPQCGGHPVIPEPRNNQVQRPQNTKDTHGKTNTAALSRVGAREAECLFCNENHVKCIAKNVNINLL